jgi:glycosyltransferase involved in cell wall biosynthesis
MPDDFGPLVCICIPTFNAEQTIEETLDSITRQSYRHLLIQIVDNNSTDRTLELAEAFGDERIVIHRHRVNVGAEGNFNRCIQLAKGQYTAIFHADDIYEAEMVAKQVAFLHGNLSAGAVFTEARLIDENGKVIGAISQPDELKITGPLHDFQTIFKSILRHSNFLICPSLMARTEVYRQDIRIWRGDLFGSSADLDVWLRMLLRHPCGILAEPLMRYRLSSVQFSAKVRMETQRSDFFRVVDHYLTQTDVQAMINDSDRENYTALDRRDRVMRAANLFLVDQPESTKELLYDLFSGNSLRAAIRNRRGLMTLLLGSYLVLASRLHLYTYGKAILFFFKRKILK